MRSLHFIAGGLAGYGALILFDGVPLIWLYIAYFCLMLVSTFVTVLIMRNKASRRRCTSHASLWEAYVAPIRRSRDFARACFCMLAFSLGTAPIFFTLLMVRDLVQVADESLQQVHFSYISIVFLVSAALSSTAISLDGGDAEGPNGASGEAAASADTGGSASSRDAFAAGASSSQDAFAIPSQPLVDDLHGVQSAAQRMSLMMASIAAFGMVCAIIPVVSFPGSVRGRLQVFYGISIMLGVTFGAVYARFQTCLWSLLPPGSDVANAMGLAAVMKVAGCGLGNFFVGFILDSFRVSEGQVGQVGQVSPVGYAIVCWFCSLTVFASFAILDGVPSEKELAPFSETAERPTEKM